MQSGSGQLLLPKMRDLSERLTDKIDELEKAVYDWMDYPFNSDLIMNLLNVVADFRAISRGVKRLESDG